MTLTERLMVTSTILAAFCLLGSVVCVALVVRLSEQPQVVMPAEVAVLAARQARNANRVHIGGNYFVGVTEWPKTLTLRRYRERYGEEIANHSDLEIAEAAWEAESGYDSKDLHKDEWIAFFMERSEKPLSAYAPANRR